jgi:hypothetical protein
MVKNKRPERSKDVPSIGEIRDALKKATDKALLDEVFRRFLSGPVTSLERWPDKALLDEVSRRGLIMEAQQRAESRKGDGATSDGTMGLRERSRRRGMRDYLRRQPVRREPGDVEKEIESLRARAAKHREYVGQLLDLLSRKRLEKMRERGVKRTDATPELADLGMLMTRAIFDHVVIAWRDALDAGDRDIESLWSYLMNDGGYQFASGLVKGDIDMPSNLGASFVYEIVQGATLSLLSIAEEDAERPATDGNT